MSLSVNAPVGFESILQPVGCLILGWEADETDCKKLVVFRGHSYNPICQLLKRRSL